jgi:hypothetical protein
VSRSSIGGAEERALARLLEHRFGGLVESLASEESFVVRAWFGMVACYAHGRLMLVLADKRPPWSGLLVPCDRERQATMRAAFPALKVHSVLGKWLLLPVSAETFEDDAMKLADLACGDDQRFGIEPQPRRMSKRRSSKRRRASGRGR